MEAFKRIKKLVSSTPIAFIILICAVVIVAGDSLARPIWYDEALTVTNFTALPGYLDIYRCYRIPNNHICYSILLRAWIDVWECFFPFSTLPLRLLTFILSWITVCLMWFFWKKRFGFGPATLVTMTFIFSPAFPIYAAAVRGYMLSALLLTLAIESCAAVRRFPNAKRITAYFALSIVCVGVMPSNLFPLLAIAMIQCPERLEQRSVKAGVALFLTPVVALIIFYLPIASQFLQAARNTGGWNDAGQAAFHYYVAFLATTFALLPAVLLGLIAKINACHRRVANVAIQSGATLNKGGEHAQPFGNVFKGGLFTAVFIIPAAMFLIRSPSPFPRVFWSMWIPGLWVFAAAVRNAEAFIRLRHRRFLPAAFLITLTAIVIFGGINHRRRADLSNWTTPVTAQDDFFSPYFSRDTFNPPKLIERLRTILQERPVLFYLSPMADPPAVLFHAKMMGFPMKTLLFDQPGRPLRLEAKSTPLPLLVIFRDKRDLAQVKERFNIENSKRLPASGFHQIMEVMD